MKTESHQSGVYLIGNVHICIAQILHLCSMCTKIKWELVCAWNSNSVIHERVSEVSWQLSGWEFEPLPDEDIYLHVEAVTSLYTDTCSHMLTHAHTCTLSYVHSLLISVCMCERDCGVWKVCVSVCVLYTSLHVVLCSGTTVGGPEGQLNYTHQVHWALIFNFQ